MSHILRTYIRSVVSEPAEPRRYWGRGGAGNPFYGKKHSESTKALNAAAHRLKFSEVLKRVALEAGVRTVWGCGNRIYIYKFDDSIKKRPA